MFLAHQQIIPGNSCRTKQWNFSFGKQHDNTLPIFTYLRQLLSIFRTQSFKTKLQLNLPKMGKRTCSVKQLSLRLVIHNFTTFHVHLQGQTHLKFMLHTSDVTPVMFALLGHSLDTASPFVTPRKEGATKSWCAFQTGGQTHVWLHLRANLLKSSAHRKVASTSSGRICILSILLARLPTMMIRDTSQKAGSSGAGSKGWVCFCQVCLWPSTSDMQRRLETESERVSLPCLSS